MNTDTDLQRQVTGVFADAAPTGYPDELLTRVLSTTSRTRPRPTWLATIKEPPMRYPARVAVGSPTLRLATILVLTLALALALGGVVVAGASLLPGQPLPPPYGPARNGSLVYEKDGDIYLADADGGNAHDIITGDHLDRYPWFSHDGRKIAFGRGPDGDLSLMVANADGTNVTELLRGDWTYGEFLASDDGIAVLRPVDGHTVLSVVGVDGTAPAVDLALGDIEPRDWVMPRPPDGEELIFTGYPHPGLMDMGLFGVRADGTQLRTIGAISTTESAAYSGTTRTPGGAILSFQNTVISPDGRTIAYGNWEPGTPGGTFDSHLHMRDLDTGAELPVPFDPDNAGGGGPHYSPDGTMVVYEGTLPGLSYAPVDGSVSARSIGPAFSYLDRQGFDFSPDGRVVLLSLKDKAVAIDVATGASTTLPDITTPPAWQRLAP